MPAITAAACRNMQPWETSRRVGHNAVMTSSTDDAGERDDPLELLRLGTAFGQRAAAEYGLAAEDVQVRTEVRVPKGRGTARWDDDGQRIDAGADKPWDIGRIDILLTGRDPETGLPFQVVIEVKATDWDKRAKRRVRPNVNRHRQQVWGYLEPMMESVDAGALAWVQAALLYPRRPTTPGRHDEISALLEPWSVAIAYVDELS